MSKCKYLDLDRSANGGLDFQENSGIRDLFFSIEIWFNLNIFAIFFSLRLCTSVAGEPGKAHRLNAYSQPGLGSEPLCRKLI